MAHFCRICGESKSNETFSGRGHRIHICRECRRLPKSEIEKADIELEITGFLDQSRISPKNQKRLESLLDHAEPSIRFVADLILQVSKTVEGKRKRWSRLREKNPELYDKCFEAGLIEMPDDYEVLKFDDAGLFYES